jgi:O-antigen ligase
VLAPRPRAIEGAAALIAVLAVAMGVIGLVAAAVTDEPLSHRTAGLWRPASTFQYSPALALLIVSALPPLLTAMCRARRWWAVLGAGAGGAVAGATLALAESRTQLAFAVLVAAAALVWPQRLVRAPRGAVAAALAVMAAAGLGAYAVNGGYVPITPAPDGTARLLALLGVLAAGTLAWLLVSAALRRGAPAAALAALLLAVGGAAVIAKPPAKLISAGIVGHTERPKRPLRPAEPRTNHAIRDRLLHGRVHLWGEAIETFADRPLQGGGADSYWFASAEHQGTRTVFYAHSLPLELAAELGIAGLLLSIGLYAASGRALWRRRTGPARWLLGPAATAFLAANLVDWPWHLAGAGAVWALALGAIVGAPGATRDGH